MQRKVTKLLLFHKRLTYSFEVGCVASFVSGGTAYKFNKFACNAKLNLIRYKNNSEWLLNDSDLINGDIYKIKSG